MGHVGLGGAGGALVTVALATVMLGVVLYQHEIVTLARRRLRRLSPAPEAPPGTERDAERLVVEHELEQAGLRLSA